MNKVNTRKKQAFWGVLGLSLGLLLASPVSATVYDYTYDPAVGVPIGGNANAGILEFFKLRFDETAQVLALTATFSGDTDGFWIGVNDGPNPKVGDIGIIYAHESAPGSGDLSASIYQYDGLASHHAPVISNRTQTAAALSNDSVTHNGGQTTYRFDLDVGLLNQTYNGFIAGMGEKVGFWLSWFSNLNPQYTNDRLTHWKTGDSAHAWWDTANQPTTNEVPEPATMTLLGGALAGLAIRRKRKNGLPN